MRAMGVQQEEGLADMISMHSLVVTLGITNIWQPLIAYTLVYTSGYTALGSCMHGGDGNCCVHCTLYVDSVDHLKNVTDSGMGNWPVSTAY